MCSSASTVRGLLGEIPTSDGTVVVDMEASPEHLARGTIRSIDHLLVVAEPWFKSLETARRYQALADDLGIERVSLVANKVRPDDEHLIDEFSMRHHFDVAARIPHDDSLLEAERQGLAPYDVAFEGPAVSAVRRLAKILEEDA